jgi:hypothetical protein
MRLVCCSAAVLQVQELLADLHAAYLSSQEYFLGNIVTTRQGSAAGEPYWVSPPLLPRKRRSISVVSHISCVCLHWLAVGLPTCLTPALLSHLQADHLCARFPASRSFTSCAMSPASSSSPALICCVSCKQIIDGQQRLTTLVMLLGYLRAWAAEQEGLGSLAERVERMLHIPADPLNPAARAR